MTDETANAVQVSVRDDLRRRFLEAEWDGRAPCPNCPSGHPACLRCGGVQPELVLCEAAPTLKFGHQKIDEGDYMDDCIYVSLEEEMEGFLSWEAEKAESRRKKAICAKDGHEPGEERIGTMHTETVAITPEYTCLRCEATYRGKKRKVRKGDFAGL